MHGEVLYFDAERGIGFANGDDGNRYHFDRGDLPGGYSPQKGVRIAFSPTGNRAGAIRPESGLVAAPAAAAAGMREARPTGSVPSISTAAGPPARTSMPGAGAAAGSLSLWGYFRHCVSGGYVQFGGRARRKEYWSFMLFFVLGTIAFTVIGAAVDGVLGNLDDEPIVLAALPSLFVLAMILPSIAVTVRRIHDLGLVGWFFLLGLIPYIGTLVIIVFALIPSQKHPNKWGEVPPGAL